MSTDKNLFKSSLLTYDVTKGLKGYMCLCVLVHHYYQFTGWFTNTYFGHFLSFLGEWAVAVFLFLSGYGLYSSYKSKGEIYIKSFPKRRLLSFYIKYVVVVLIYFLFDYSEINNPTLIIKSFSWGGTVVSFGWYLQMVLVLYLLFFFVFRVFTSKWIRCVVLLLMTIVYSVISDRVGIQHTALPSFCFGIIMAVHSDKLEEFVTKKKNIIGGMMASFIVFFSVYLLYVNGTIMGKFEINQYLWKVIAATSDFAIIFFVIGMIASSRLLGIRFFDNKAIMAVGEYSLEIYAIQGLVLRKISACFEERGLFVMVSFAIIMTSAFILHFVMKKITSLLR